MKHHRYNQNFQFVREPIEFNKYTAQKILQYCVGGTLYMPGTQHITQKVADKAWPDLTSMVMCFEDAIAEGDLPLAEQNVLEHLERISRLVLEGTLSHNDIPLTFVRVRNPAQFRSFAEELTPQQADVLSGFVFPKLYSENLQEYLGFLEYLNRKLGVLLYGMPILEGKSIAFKEGRIEELRIIRKMLKPFKDIILNIRVGGTDFSSIFGVRRGINYSIYDILTVRDCLSDILNFFNREEEEYVISAPVWEYFLAYQKVNIDQLLEENIHRSLLRRNIILNEAIDGLLREVILDKANGFVGKTIIHPSHVKYVNAMQAVTTEEYDDACQILDRPGGVIKSANGNKMNEANPHKNWAKKIICRSMAFGVVENQTSYLKLMLA